MPRFLLEAHHEPEEKECLRVLDAFLTHGAHYLALADWGCGDGVQHLAHGGGGEQGGRNGDAAACVPARRQGGVAQQVLA